MISETDVKLIGIPQGMPLPFVKELIELNIEKIQYSLFLTENCIENNNKQQAVFFKAMKSMATRDVSFCFEVGQLNAQVTKETEHLEKANKASNDAMKDLLKAREEINNV